MWVMTIYASALSNGLMSMLIGAESVKVMMADIAKLKTAFFQINTSDDPVLLMTRFAAVLGNWLVNHPCFFEFFSHSQMTFHALLSSHKPGGLSFRFA